MRSAVLATALSTSGLFFASQAQLIPFFNNEPARQGLVERLQTQLQQAMSGASNSGPGIQLPPTSNDDSTSSGGKPTGDVILSDVIGNSRQINVFAGFTRDIDSVSKRLDDSSQNTTVLAPLNSAIGNLPRKPWEDPREYAALGATAYDGQDGEDRAHRNLRRFTEAHVVPVSPWKEGEKVQSLGGGLLWWEKTAEGQSVVQPGNVEIDVVERKVANGEVWILKDALNYAS